MRFIRKGGNFHANISYSIALLVITTGIIYTAVFFWIGQNFLGFSGLVTVLFLCSGIVLLRLGKNTAAKWVVIVVTNAATLFFSIILGHSSGIHYFFYGLCILSFVLFEFGSYRNHFFGFFISGLGWSLANFSQLVVDPFLMLQKDIMIFLEALTGLMSFVILGMSFKFFLQEINRSNKRILESNTKLKKAFQDLKESKSAAEELARQSAYATLTRGIAHEIKNPLQMIYGRADLVLDDLDNKESVKKFAEVVIRNVERLKKLIHSMLEYGTSSGIKKDTFSINKLLEDIVELSQHKSKENYISLTADCGPDQTVFGNKVFIYQAILNIVVNAIQYTGKNGRITITTSTKTYHNKDGKMLEGVEILVSDTGVGIDPDTINDIFVPYFTSKNKPENIGLGLSMAFKAITENDGMLDVESQVGQGTTFMIYLPLASSSDQ